MCAHNAQRQPCLLASLLPELPRSQQDARLHDRADTPYEVLQSQAAIALATPRSQVFTVVPGPAQDESPG